MQNVTRHNATPPAASVEMYGRVWEKEIDVYILETDNETVYYKFLDHKTGDDLGEFYTYINEARLTETDVFLDIETHLQARYPDYEEMTTHLYTTKFKKG